MEIISTLAVIAQDVFTAPDLTTAREIISTHISESKIKEEDRQKMLLEVSRIESLVKLQRYMSNALLKYEGLGL